eukprot:1152416-Pelagomonas_calceolata.AAC.3
MKDSLRSATTSNAAHADNECACCQICTYTGDINAADTWACSACASLNNAQKIGRECQFREEHELNILGSPGCPPGSLRKLKGHARQSEPDLSRPTVSSALSNFERQGFEKPDAKNTWRQKLDTELS